MNRMRDLRTEKGISMREAAAALEMPYTTYVNYEKGLREPNSETLIQIANYYNTSIDYLLGRSSDRIDDFVLDLVNEIDDDLLFKYGNIYEALKAQKERANSKENSPTPTSAEEPFTSHETGIIKKYRTLDAHGKDIVEVVLDKEADRMQAIREAPPVFDLIPFRLSEQRASAGTGMYLGPECFRTVMVRKDALPRKASFGVPIAGNSMEPKYHDGDILSPTSRCAWAISACTRWTARATSRRSATAS